MSMRFCFLAAVILGLAGCQGSSAPSAGNSETAVETGVAKQPVSDPFPNAAEVRLFVAVGYDSGKRESILSKAEGVQLNAAQQTVFEHTLSMAPPPEFMEACFVPHHFFRYYDAQGDEIGVVSVCFCCAGVQASGSDALVPRDGLYLAANYADLKKLVRELGERTDVQC